MSIFHKERTAQLAPLQPLPAPVGVFKQFVYNDVRTVALKEKFFTLGDTFYITDAESKVPVFECMGAVLTARQKKTLSTADGSHTKLYDLKEKLLSFPRDFNGFVPDTDQQLFHVENKFSIGKAKMHMTFDNVFDGRQAQLDLKGDFFQLSAEILLGSHVVANISRSYLNARQILGDNESFYVSVCPGMDVALIIGFVLALADKQEKN